jgi:hypothetical protein
MRIDLGYNLEDVKNEFEALPQSTYEAKIAECEFTTSKSSGKPMLKFTWEVLDGEFQGRKLFDNVLIETSWKVKQYAEAAGIPNGSELQTEDFKGAVAILTVGYAKKQNPDDDSEPLRNQITRVRNAKA